MIHVWTSLTGPAKVGLVVSLSIHPKS
jgi:hypothetical protein